ncbi:MAG: ATP-binding protein [Acidobacteriia bacterium]|nr:ATP-binding protein [Terriglobia bacterium]
MTPVDVDLNKDDLATISDPELYAAVEAFTRATASPTDRTQEGYLLDFKATWSDSALRTVAAFANTFGGLLLVGVSETGGRADQLVGLAAQRQELKTSIASSIASNISPTPPYEIRDVAFQDGSGRHLCIVRVRKGNSLYLITKKGEQPVYIRNEDESRPADAARLQALLATRWVPGQAPAEPATKPTIGTQNLYVTLAQQGAAQGTRVRSKTFLLIRLTPEESLPVRLDLTVEQKLFSIVRSTYPELAANVDDRDRSLGASFTEYRLRDWYQITYLEAWRDYEIRWAIDSSGELHFVTQVRCKVQDHGSPAEVWSLCDMMTNLDCTIEVAHQFWNYLNYPGEAQILSELRVESLPLLERASGLEAAYASAFYQKNGPRKRATPLSSTVLTKAKKQGVRAYAAVDLNYAARCGSHAEPVAILSNQFLRDLGYAANIADLRPLL